MVIYVSRAGYSDPVENVIQTGNGANSGNTGKSQAVESLEGVLRNKTFGSGRIDSLVRTLVMAGNQPGSGGATCLRGR